MPVHPGRMEPIDLVVCGSVAVNREGARVGKGCVVRDTIVGFGASVPPGTWVERRVIMPQRNGFAPGLDDSVVGGAVFTPFGDG